MLVGGPSLWLRSSLILLAAYAPGGEEAPRIDLWYGPTQLIPRRVPAQRWVNILGRITASKSRVRASYRVNNGERQPLVLGPDGKRLERSGDFNIELDYDRLKPGDNAVEIEAASERGPVVRSGVRLVRRGWDPAEPPVDISWAKTPVVQTVAQAVDGRWVATAEGVRTAESGYDRILALGARSWKNYTVAVPVKFLAFAARYANPEGGAAAGIVVRWTGHVDWKGERPREGWWPLGAALWYGWEPGVGTPHLMLHGNRGRVLAKDTGRHVELGAWYMMKLRARTSGGRHEYSAKFWPRSGAEPDGWTLSAWEPLAEPDSGSVLLIAHQADVVFGDASMARVE